MSEQKKTVLITGGAMGQGRAHAVKYAQNGFNVVLADMLDPEDERFQETIKELNELGAEVLAVKANICSTPDMENLFAKAWEKFGRSDVVIANAGVINFGNTWELTDEQVEKVINIDLIGTWRTDKYATQYMLKQGFGRIINIASQVGQKGSVEHCHYAAAKAGVIGFTKSLAREVGKYNITANCIAPGPIETQLMGVVSDEWRKNKEAELVLPRFGELEEILPTAVFLAAEPDGNLYTGQTLGPNLGDVMF